MISTEWWLWLQFAAALLVALEFVLPPTRFDRLNRWTLARLGEMREQRNYVVLGAAIIGIAVVWGIVFSNTIREFRLGGATATTVQSALMIVVAGAVAAPLAAVFEAPDVWIARRGTDPKSGRHFESWYCSLVFGLGVLFFGLFATGRFDPPWLVVPLALGFSITWSITSLALVGIRALADFISWGKPWARIGIVAFLVSQLWQLDVLTWFWRWTH